MSHVISSRALTGAKLYINKAIHALLMHCYTTFNMLIPGPQNCCCHEMCTALPQNKHSPWKQHSRNIGEKAKHNSARNYAKCSKCFQFLCNKSDRTWFFSALTFARSLGRCWKPWPLVSVFNTSHGTWRMLMHEKPCLIPIIYKQQWSRSGSQSSETHKQLCFTCKLIHLNIQWLWMRTAKA